MTEPIVVIGAGIIGLTTALRLQLSLPNPITIIARDLPGPTESFSPSTTSSHLSYASPWAGAHNRFVLPIPGSPTEALDTRDHEFSLETFRHMRTLEKHGLLDQAGVRFMQGVEHFERLPDSRLLAVLEKGERFGVEGLEVLKELPSGVSWGYTYPTWCVNPMVYCSFLLRRFVLGGGKVVKREVACAEDVFSIAGLESAKVVVNRSGTGFNDPASFPTRGQTCLVANTFPLTITRQNADGSWSFCIPRGLDGGTIIGGTREPNNWSATPSLKVRAEILRRFRKTCPEDVLRAAGVGDPRDDVEEGTEAGFTVLRDIVGRRPTRTGGMRLEAERVGGGRVVVHAYGMGARGYELSWGVGGKAVELVIAALGRERSRL